MSSQETLEGGIGTLHIDSLHLKRTEKAPVCLHVAPLWEDYWTMKDIQVGPALPFEPLLLPTTVLCGNGQNS